MTSSRKTDAASSSWPSRSSVLGSARGHLAMKSGPFCPGSSSRLASQRMVEDQMMSHYSRISSAKAAVDSSLPKSLLTSVKYRDQQRRSRLRREARRAEQDVRSSASLSRSGSRPSSARPASPARTWSPSPPPRCGSALALSSSLALDGGAPRDAGPPQSPPPHQLLLLHGRDAARWADLRLRGGSQRAGASLPGSQRARSLLSCRSAGAASAPERSHRDARSRTFAGADVLEKHAEAFTAAERPFTPRMLRTDASAALLSRTRHYAPPRRRRQPPPAAPARTFVERDAQTDPDSEDMYLTDADHARWVLEQARYTEGLEDPVRARDWFQATSLTPGSRSVAVERARAEEEELKYLEFIGQVTDDILAMGLFSNSVLVRVFERHVEKNRHRLEEAKMRHMLEVLKTDLGMEKSRDPGYSLPRDWRHDGTGDPLARSLQSPRRNARDERDSPGRPRQNLAPHGYEPGDSGHEWGRQHGNLPDAAGGLRGRGDASFGLSGRDGGLSARDEERGDFAVDAALDDSSALPADEPDDISAKYRRRRESTSERLGGLLHEEHRAGPADDAGTSPETSKSIRELDGVGDPEPVSAAVESGIEERAGPGFRHRSPRSTGASSPAEDTGEFTGARRHRRERERGGDPEPVCAAESGDEERAGPGFRHRSPWLTGASSPAEDANELPETGERNHERDGGPAAAAAAADQSKVEDGEDDGENRPADAANDDDDDFFGGGEQTLRAGSGLRLGRTMVTKDIEKLQMVLTRVLLHGEDDGKTNGQTSADEGAGLGREDGGDGGDGEQGSSDREGEVPHAERKERDEGVADDDDDF